MPAEFYVDPKTGERKIKIKGYEQAGFEEQKPEQPLIESPIQAALGQTIEGITPPSPGAPTQRYEATPGGVQKTYLPGEEQKQVYEPLGIPTEKQAKMAAPEKQTYEALRGIAGGSMLQTRLASLYAPKPEHAEVTMAPQFKYSAMSYENVPTYKTADTEAALQAGIAANLPKYRSVAEAFRGPEDYLQYLAEMPQTAESYQEAQMKRMLEPGQRSRALSEIATAQQKLTEEQGAQGLTAPEAPKQYEYITKEQAEKEAELGTQKSDLLKELQANLNLTDLPAEVSRGVLTEIAQKPLAEQEQYLQNLKDQLAQQKSALAGIESPEAIAAKAAGLTGAKRAAALAKIARYRDVGLEDAYKQTQKKIVDLEGAIKAAEDRERFGEAEYLKGIQRDLQEEQNRITSAMSPVTEQLTGELGAELGRKQAEYGATRQTYEQGTNLLTQLTEQPGLVDTIAKEAAAAQLAYQPIITDEFGRMKAASDYAKSFKQNKEMLEGVSNFVRKVDELKAIQGDRAERANRVAMDIFRMGKYGWGGHTTGEESAASFKGYASKYSDWIGEDAVHLLHLVADRYPTELGSPNRFGQALATYTQEVFPKERQQLANQMGMTPDKIATGQGILTNYVNQMAQRASAAVPGKFTEEQLKAAIAKNAVANIPDYASLIG